jgi:hypothetical protein
MIRVKMKKQVVQFFVLFFLCSCQTVFAQSIFVGPDKKFEQKNLRIMAFDPHCKAGMLMEKKVIIRRILHMIQGLSRPT